MSMLTISLATREEASRRVLEAFAGRPQGAHLSFASPEVLWKVLSFERWELLKAMTGQGEIAANSLSLTLGRDAASIAADLQALFEAGIVDAAENGRFAFLHDAIHVDFVLRAA
jgi:predicted transcriptional regulator